MLIIGKAVKLKYLGSNTKIRVNKCIQQKIEDNCHFIILKSNNT